MGITNGTDLGLNITEIIDLISVIVNFLGLLFFAMGGFASALVGLMVLRLLIGFVKPLIKDFVLGKAFER